MRPEARRAGLVTGLVICIVKKVTVSLIYSSNGLREGRLTGRIFMCVVTD